MLRSLYCRQCFLLDGNAFGRTCCHCRSVEIQETADRIAAVQAAPAARRRIERDLRAAPMVTIGGQALSARMIAGRPFGTQ